jgi:hypothetical protein
MAADFDAQAEAAELELHGTAHRLDPAPLRRAFVIC